MAGNTRQKAQEKIDQAIFHFNTAGKDLAEFAIIYEELHPELSTPVYLVLDSVTRVIELIEALKQQF